MGDDQKVHLKDRAVKSSSTVVETKHQIEISMRDILQALGVRDLQSVSVKANTPGSPASHPSSFSLSANSTKLVIEWFERESIA